MEYELKAKWNVMNEYCIYVIIKKKTNGKKWNNHPEKIFF